PTLFRSDATTTDTTTAADTTTSTAADTTTTTSSTTESTTSTTTASSTTTTPAPIFNPKIASDQIDYSPGATVTLTGTGWQPGEAVHIFVNDDKGQSWSYSADVGADVSGHFVRQFVLPTSFVATYSVTATGLISGTATTTF